MIKNTIDRLLLIFFLLMAMQTASAVTVGPGGISTAFSKGASNIAVVAGSGSAYNDNYLILGLGLGYYLANGLEVGIDVQQWFSGSPAITKVSPQIRYVFTRTKIKPYVGAFYRRTFVEGFTDRDSAGARAGAYFSSRNGVYIGAGLVYEKYSDCPAALDCSVSYPEVLFSVSF